MASDAAVVLYNHRSVNFNPNMFTPTSTTDFFHVEHGEHISAVSRMTQTLCLAEISLKDLESIRNEMAGVMESTFKDLPMLTEMRVDW